MTPEVLTSLAAEAVAEWIGKDRGCFEIKRDAAEFVYWQAMRDGRLEECESRNGDEAAIGAIEAAMGKKAA